MSYERTIWPGDLTEITGKRHFLLDETAPEKFVDEKAMVRLKHMEDGIYDAHVAIDAYEARWFNVVEYGATGDGITDDTAAIQAAINAAKAIPFGVLYFPKPSNYYKVTQLSLNTISGMIWMGEEGADLGDFGTHTIKGSAASVLDIQKCTNMTFKNLRFGGDGSNTCWDIHGGGAGAYLWSIENCNFHEFDVGWQIGQTSTENGGGVTTYAYGWSVDRVTFEDCAYSIILDAQAFDSLHMKNVSFEDYNNISVINMETIAGISGNIIMENVFGSMGTSATHAIKLYGYQLDMTNCRWEGAGNYLGLYSASVGGDQPSILRNVSFTRSDGGGNSINWGIVEGLILIGCSAAGNINFWGGEDPPIIAINTQGTFTGDLNSLVELKHTGAWPNRVGWIMGPRARVEQFYSLKDGIAAPGANAGYARIYVDTADGDLKVVFGDGTVKTIVVDT